MMLPWFDHYRRHHSSVKFGLIFFLKKLIRLIVSAKRLNYENHDLHGSYELHELAGLLALF